MNGPSTRTVETNVKQAENLFLGKLLSPEKRPTCLFIHSVAERSCPSAVTWDEFPFEGRSMS